MKFMALVLLLGLTCNPSGCFAAEQPIDDQMITETLSRAFSKSALPDDSLILVSSERGYVLLVGQVLSEESKNEATRIAAFQAAGMRRIINELQVVNSIDRSTADSDSALAARISSLLNREKADIAGRLKFTVHRSVVYLMGALPREPAMEAARLISQLSGISRITTAFEFVEE